MSRINSSRVVLGGLTAGLVLCAGEFILSKPLLGGMWSAVTEARNLPPVGLGRIPVFVLMNLVLGIVLVYLYAAIRPRYGAGPKTALRAGLLVVPGLVLRLHGGGGHGCLAGPDGPDRRGLGPVRGPAGGAGGSERV